jgi:hypothetical protein
MGDNFYSEELKSLTYSLIYITLLYYVGILLFYLTFLQSIFLVLCFFTQNVLRAL